MAPGCVLTNTRVELVDGDNNPITGPSNEAKDQQELGQAFGHSIYAERGARLVTPPPGAPNLSATVHWWYETGTDVRYRLRYYINQPNGVACDP